MNKTPIFIAIPAIFVFLVLSSVFAWRLATQSTRNDQLPTREAVMVLQEGEGKPTSSFHAATSEVDAEIALMQSELSALADDGGAAEFAALEQDLSGL